MPSPQALFLDFDGVVLESVDVKTAAMRALFAERPEHVEAIIHYHRENAGVSRYDKFRYYYRELFKQPLDDAELARLDREFSALVRREISTCLFVPGARELLERWSGRIPIHIVSATPERELKDIVRERGLDSFFRSVNGSPAKKAEHVARIIARDGLDPARCYFVGDAAADAQAAAANRVPFVLRETPIVPAGVSAVARLPDLTGLDRLWPPPETCLLAWSEQSPASAPAAGGRWIYLGRSWSALRRWETALGPRYTRLEIAGTMHACADKARGPFLDYLKELARRHGDRPEWWLTRISDENTLSGSLFSDVCWLLTAHEMLSREGATLIVAENEGLLDCLQKLAPSCRRLRTWSDGPRRAALALRSWARWLRFAWIFYGRLLAARLTRQGERLPARDRRPVALLHSCINADYFSTEKGRDAYFGALPDELEQRGYQVVVLPWLYNPGRRTREAFAWFRARRDRYLIAEDFLGPADFWRAALEIQRSALLPIGRQELEGIDISALVSGAKALQRFNIGAAGFALYPLLFERLARKGWSPDVFIDTFENSLTEKPSALALRRHCAKTRIVGFEHVAAMAPLMLQHVAVPDPELSPLPDAIVCNSAYMRRCLVEEGFPRRMVRVGPSLRYPHLLKSRPSRNPENGIVFVGFSLEPETTEELIFMLSRAFPQAGGLGFRIKPHPQMARSQWERLARTSGLPAHMQIVDGPIAQWVARASCAVVGASTVAMDFALSGVPVIPVGRATVLDFSPLARFPDWPRTVRDPETLRSEVERLSRLDDSERRALEQAAERLRAECISPINDDTVAAFIEPKHPPIRAKEKTTP